MRITILQGLTGHKPDNLLPKQNYSRKVVKSEYLPTGHILFHEYYNSPTANNINNFYYNRRGRMTIKNTFAQGRYEGKGLKVVNTFEVKKPYLTTVQKKHMARLLYAYKERGCNYVTLLIEGIGDDPVRINIFINSEGEKKDVVKSVLSRIDKAVRQYGLLNKA